MARELSRAAQIERSIIKTYHKQLWTPFINALKQYELIAPGDRIAVCISGGKDSMLLAKLMQQLHRHSDACKDHSHCSFSFSLKYFTVPWLKSVET